MDLNSSFDVWFDSFSKNASTITEKSIKELLKIAYLEGFKECEKESPLYAKAEDGTILEVPREVNESLIPKGDRWIDEDFDVDEWISKTREAKDAKE